MIKDEFYKKLFFESRIPQAIFAANLKKNLANQAFFDFIGYSSEEWKELSIEDVTHPDDYMLDIRLVNEIFSGERKEYQIEKRYIHKSGALMHGLLNVSLIEDLGGEDGKLILAQIIDITEKKIIEKTYRKSEEKYRLLAEHSSDIIILHAEDSTYLYISPSVSAILGFQPEEMEGRMPYQFIHPDDIHYIRKVQEQLRLTGDPVLITYRSLKKDGTYTWLETAIKQAVNEETGKVSGLISISRDIQKRKETDDLLRRSEKLAVVGQLAAAVAHEIRNPLTSIKGFLQLFQSTKEFNDRFLAIVLDELNRVETIISEFLTMARPHNEKAEPIMLNRLIHQVVQLLQPQALMDNKEITFDASGRETEIIGDANSLKQVFVNLIQNALDALKEKGTVTVQIAAEDQNVIVRISDNGCGIPKELLIKLGEPFYSTKEKGTGLGLMTSFQILESHGARVEVASTEGEGTEVTIYFPGKKSQAED